MHTKNAYKRFTLCCNYTMQKAHIDIGDINAFKYALTVDDNDLRQTWLLDLLTKTLDILQIIWYN